MRLTKNEMEIRRNRMIHVAYKLFSEYGIDGISIEKIAEEAGFSRRSVFRYFDNKVQLAEQTQRILWKEIVDCITKDSQLAVSMASNGLEEMEALMQGFENLYRNHSDYLLFSYDYQSYLIRNHIKLPEEQLDKMLSDVRPIFLHALERGQKDGSISTSHPASKQFLLVWAIVRSFIEQLAIHSQLYEGENVWVLIYPDLIEKMLDTLRV